MSCAVLEPSIAPSKALCFAQSITPSIARSNAQSITPSSHLSNDDMMMIISSHDDLMMEGQLVLTVGFIRSSS